MPLESQGNPTETLNSIGNDLRLLDTFELFLHDAATLWYLDDKDAPRVLYQGHLSPNSKIRLTSTTRDMLPSMTQIR